MRWQTKVTPPNREMYLNRCGMLQRCLKHADVMPPFLVAANCLFVLRQAFGGEWRIIRWLLLNIAHDRWEAIKERAWLNWHLYARLRTREEIVELVDQDIERVTGEDCREWPSVISDEESAEV